MVEMLKKSPVCAALFAALIFSCAQSYKAAPSYEFYEVPEAPQAQEAALGRAVRSAADSKASDDNRMVTYSIEMALSVQNVDETRKTLVEQVKIHKGYIVNESMYRVTTRIPADNMDSFVNVTKNIGKVEHERKVGVDITEQYRDNTTRLKSLKTVRDRYLVLLEAADSVKDMLSIEKELERINTEIEILEGQIKYAELSVAYSHITVDFRTLREEPKQAMPGPLGWIFYGLYYGIKWLFVWD